MIVASSAAVLAGASEKQASEKADSKGDSSEKSSDRLPQAEKLKPTKAKLRGEKPLLPYVWLHRKKGYVDLPGEIVLREGLIELIATIRGGKTHEAIATVHARPQHIHLALLLLRLQPGSPGKWVYKKNGDGKKTPHPVNPTGSPVRVSFVLEEDGEKVERPASAFVVNRFTKKPLPSNVFLFSGSTIRRRQDGSRFYTADMTGDVIALVSFGSELLAWPRAASTSNDRVAWHARTEAIPPKGTSVTVRLRRSPGVDLAKLRKRLARHAKRAEAKSSPDPSEPTNKP